MAPFCLRGRFHHYNKSFKLHSKNGKRKSGTKNMQEKLRRLKAEMEEISEEQKNIREGQRKVREKFEAIESGCEELKRETKTIIQQSARTQIKLALMFRIFKASQQADLATVANLKNLLREIVRRENEERQASGDN
ncbi:uncharacterized protein LOC111300620 [Durio zibethinus]|uniref:Uncharacterized protein LOC111300620 n=1 Tax=Durio zibethinus TaxID=66656 RepID=A0A6P5ZGK3_DURZI|nr:uncharacterized protein LOC111300620 [Durio zibethinus]